MFYDKDSTDRTARSCPTGRRSTVKGVPFQFVDPQSDKKPNVIMLYSKNGADRADDAEVGQAGMQHAGASDPSALSGVSGWGYPYSKEGGAVMIVRLHYADGKTEDHRAQRRRPLRGLHPPGRCAEIGVRLRDARPADALSDGDAGRDAALTAIEFVKGPDASAPIVMAVTVETK